MKRLFLSFIACIVACASLTGCKQVKTQIAYTVYPVGFLIQRLAGDSITYTSIQSDTIIQRATMNADYKTTLKDSAVFFHIGQLEPYLSMYSSELSSEGIPMSDLSTLNAVYDFKRYTSIETDGQITYVESPYYTGDQFNTIDTDKQDLYLWTDPIAMLSMAKDIREWLLATYPTNATLYQDNFSKLETDLINLDAQYQALTTANEKDNKVIRFVSMTASFGNWQKVYGFQVYPIILSKYGALPSASQLEIIENRIKKDGVKYIVYEPNMTEDMTELFNKVEDDLNLTRVELSNLSSLTTDENELGKDYLSVMYENLSTLETMTENRVAQEVTGNEVSHDTLESTEETPEETAKTE